MVTFKVNFIGIPASGLPPLQVQFTDLTVGNPTTWQWEFGDGGSSTEQNPRYTYRASGIYDVSLYADNGRERGSITKEDYISTMHQGPGGGSGVVTFDQFIRTIQGNPDPRYQWYWCTVNSGACLRD